MHARYVYGQVIQWGIRRLYHEFAPWYDLVAAGVSRGYWQHWITAALPLLRSGLTLELGCGTGYLQRALALRASPHLGLDRSRQILRQASYKLAAGSAPSRLVCADARGLPIASESCQNVIATFPAPYILDPQTLREVKRVLAPQGQFLIVDNGQLIEDDVYTTVVDLAYRATLQARDTDPRPRLLNQAGFIVREEWRMVEQSAIWILCATLPTS